MRGRKVPLRILLTSKCNYRANGLSVMIMLQHSNQDACNHGRSNALHPSFRGAREVRCGRLAESHDLLIAHSSCERPALGPFFIELSYIIYLSIYRTYTISLSLSLMAHTRVRA